MSCHAQIRRTSLWVFGTLLCAAFGVREAAAEETGLALPFGELPPDARRAIERRCEPPPLTERDNPYSTPMYYLFCKGYKDGIKDEVRLDRNRPDWQEQLVRDWADLGLTRLHLPAHPGEIDDPHRREAILDLFALADKYGIRIGIRLCGDEKIQGIEASGWGVHPRNPENKIREYVAWAGRLAAWLKGRVEYYVVGDEIDAGRWEERQADGTTKGGQTVAEDRRWTPEVYMEVFKQISGAIRAADSQAKLSMFGGNLETRYIRRLLELGYADHADGVASNFISAPKPAFASIGDERLYDFVAQIKALRPAFGFYSNGMGYIGLKAPAYNPVNHGYPLHEPEDHARWVAKAMFRTFDAGWTCAPYYITVRQWVLPDGRLVPHWYGFYGFQELAVDKFDNMTVRRFPTWYAFQTITHVFHSRSRIKHAPFEVRLSPPAEMSQVFLRDDYECLIVLWNDSPGKRAVTRITLPSRKYLYPVRVSLFNYRSLASLPCRFESTDQLLIPDIDVGNEPVIIRLVAEEPRPNR